MVPGAAWYGMPPPGRCIVGEVGEKRRPSDLWKEERRGLPPVADDRAGYGLIRRDGGSTNCCKKEGE